MYKYKAIKVNGIKCDEHRYVMEQYIGRKLSRYECVHHKDGDTRNNDISNLEIISLEKHSRLHRTGKNMSNKTKSKISNKLKNNLNSQKYSVELILKIKEDIKNGLRNKDICAKYNVNRFLVTNLKMGRKWKRLDLSNKV
jgi:hypothetical protein